MAEEQPDQVVKRWAGYVCPMCRMIFRLEAGHGGRRAQCPGCQAVLVLGGGTGPAPTDAAAGVEGGAHEGAAQSRHDEAEGAVAKGWEDVGTESEDGESAERQRIKKRKGVREEPQWERRKRRSRRPSKRGPLLIVLVLLAIVAGGAYWAWGVMDWGGMDWGGKPGGASRDQVSGGVGDGPSASDMGLESDMDVVVDDIRESVEAFLEAGTVDGLLETVRDRERLDPVIRRFYADGYEPPSFRAVACDGSLQTLGVLYSVKVEMEDASPRPVAVERAGQRYLIDWESWVGYSDLPWEEFMRSRPTEPMTFRVKCENSDYYNYKFADDRTWQAFRLESPDGERTLYGYVPRDSPLAKEMTPLDPEVRLSTLTLRLRYPEGAERADQVVVDRVVTTGWVVVGGDGKE